MQSFGNNILKRNMKRVLQYLQFNHPTHKKINVRFRKEFNLI